MRLCNDTITLFNTRVDDDKGYDVYVPTVIRGVSWFCEIASTVDKNGLNGANKFTIRIPENADFSGKTYASPVAYVGGDPDNLFTLKNGDIIVHGVETATDLNPAKLQEKYGEIVTVLGVTDNRRTPNARHWKVVGK